MATRILIADDHEIMRRGLRMVLEAKPEWQICGEATNGEQAVAKAEELHPDLIILDVSMPVLGGFQAAQRILQSNTSARILLYTTHESAYFSSEARKIGVRGFLCKTSGQGDLIGAVSSVLEGQSFVTTDDGNSLETTTALS